MSDSLEVLYTSDLSEQQWSCCAWDYKTATSLMVYKGGGSVNARCFCFVANNHIITANSAKPLFHVWPINNQEQISSVRFVAPGKANALAISPDGNYLVAGIQETLYIWQITSGRMLANLSKHYQPVTCIKFTDDGSHFVSAGLDGGVLVWNLAQVICNGDNNQEPLYAFNDHGLSVTDVHIGSGGMRSYLYSVSLDRTCKIYDLSSGILLLNVVFTESLSCVASNGLETSVHVGTTEGQIYEFHINSIPRTKEYHMTKENMNKYLGHKGTVSCIALSIDGETLVSGGEDAQVHLWHIPSKQLIRTLAHRGPISNVTLSLRKLSDFGPENTFLNMFTNNLKRMMDSANADESHTVEVLVEENDDDDCQLHQQIKHTSTNGMTTLTGSNTEEVDALRQEIKKLKNINRKLFSISTKNILNS
ncbi:WD repeat-containing protein 18 [Episyrphus balteatus]|uniref:WD repeat-containing protein 18 n=1 Tax=Episyrphus balteatus TaxID=286459 RepID=UPI0024867034|nr:WD repeat-containing protein 18 [Episyrphus balteatus]